MSRFEILTSTEPAAIAVVRLTGANVPAFLTRHVRPHGSPTARSYDSGQVFRAALLDDEKPIDDILVSIHDGPPPGDVRLHLHGNRWLVQRCRDLALTLGFSESDEPPRALWPARNAVEAEAFALLPRMLTIGGVRWLLRQADTLTRALRAAASTPIEQAQATCRAIAARRSVVDWFARPCRIALVGPPNAGKSTLANALAGQTVSLVSPTPGTTRDWVEVPGEVDEFPVVWLDTAGLRPTDSMLESQGIRQTKAVIATADAVVVVLDAADSATADAPMLQSLRGLQPACVALNKSEGVDRGSGTPLHVPAAWRSRAVPISALHGQGLDGLKATLISNLGRRNDLDAPAAFTDRQVRHLSAIASCRDRNSFEYKLLELIDGG